MGALLLAGLVAVALVGASGRAGDGRQRTVDVGHQSQTGTELDPSAFSPGACVAFAPTRGDRHATVFLDAGHGGLDPGGMGTTQSGRTIYEAQETLPMELDAMSILRADGFRVVVSRTTDSSVVKLQAAYVDGTELTDLGAHADVAARDQCANRARAQALVGIYLDTGASPDNAGSITGYDADRSFSPDNLRLATLVQTDVLAAMNAKGWGIPDGGVLPDSGLGSLVPASGTLADEAADYDHLMLLGPADPGYFTDPSAMPGALIEPLFITDPFEGTLAASTQGQMVVAQGLARAIEAYFTPTPKRTAAKAGSRPTAGVSG